jgi:hypothetical protein
MDTCIVLRTAVVKDGRMHVQAVDDLHGAHFRRARDRAGRKTRRQGVERVVTRVEIGAREARTLCRVHRLFRRARRDGHLHRPAHRRGEAFGAPETVPAGKPAARASSGS